MPCPKQGVTPAKHWLSTLVSSYRVVAEFAPSHEPISDGRTSIRLGLTQSAVVRGAALSLYRRRRCPSRARGGTGKNSGPYTDRRRRDSTAPGTLESWPPRSSRQQSRDRHGM